MSNLTLSCQRCNEAKGTKSVEEYLAGRPKVLETVLRMAKRPLGGAAAVNATRNAVFFGLRDLGLPVEAGTGGRTKYNRERFGIPKTHALDAACVGRVEALRGWKMGVLGIKATGRGSYQRTRVTASGFPRGYLMRQKRVHGFQTGDMVVATVPSGKKRGKYAGRVAVRRTGSFNVQTQEGVVQGISWRRCRVVLRADGYGYALLPPLRSEVSVLGGSV